MQGVQCKDCRYNAHKKCSEKVPRDCTGEVPQDLLLADKQGDSTEFDHDDNSGGEGEESDEGMDSGASASSASSSHVAGGGGGGGGASAGATAAAPAASNVPHIEMEVRDKFFLVFTILFAISSLVRENPYCCEHTRGQQRRELCRPKIKRSCCSRPRALYTHTQEGAFHFFFWLLWGYTEEEEGGGDAKREPGREGGRVSHLLILRQTGGEGHRRKKRAERQEKGSKIKVEEGDTETQTDKLVRK